MHRECAFCYLRSVSYRVLLITRVLEPINYFRVGNASSAFSEVREYAEMKVRTLLTRRKRRRKTSTGWRRWSNEYLYGTVGLYWDWKVQPLPGVESMS
jgi:RNA-directed DNA polymerase